MVRPSNCKKVHVRISGQRSSVGAIIGERSSEDMLFISGTLKAFAVAVNSNTHTGPDYRLQPCAATHDEACNNALCLKSLTATCVHEKRKALMQASNAAQRAARHRAGYFF